MAGHVTTDFYGILGTLDTETLTMAAFGAALVPPTSTVTLASLGTPLDTDTTTATWNSATGVLEVDDLTGITATDVAFWVAAYDDGGGDDVVCTVELSDAVTYSSDTVSFPLGIARIYRDHEERITALEAAVFP